MSENRLKIELQENIIHVSDMFYQNNIQNGNDELPQLIQQLTTFGGTLRQEDLPQYMVVLKSIMEAMECKDYILLADLLVFELNPLIDRY